MHHRRFGLPIVHADPEGFVFLSGPNVALAPPRMASAMARFSGPDRRAAGPGIQFFAFADTRGGAAGCRGFIREAGDLCIEIGDLEAFGAPAGLGFLGDGLGRYLAEGGRSVEVVAGDIPRERGRVTFFMAGLSAGGQCHEPDGGGRLAP